MTLQDIKNIADSVDQDSQDLMTDYAEDLLQFGDWSELEEFSEYLGQLIDSKGKTIASKVPQYYKQIERYWLLVTFSCFVTKDPVVQSALLQKKIFAAINAGFDPDNITEQFERYYDSEEYVEEKFKLFIKDLEQNSESFGSNPIELDGSKVLPLIKNWILDYSRFPSQSPKRGSVERLNYVNQSPNTRQLTQVQRTTLLKVLELYDDFINPQLKMRGVADLGDVPEPQIAPPKAAQVIPQESISAPQPQTSAKPAAEPNPLTQTIEERLEALKKRT